MIWLIEYDSGVWEYCTTIEEATQHVFAHVGYISSVTVVQPASLTLKIDIDLQATSSIEDIIENHQSDLGVWISPTTPTEGVSGLVTGPSTPRGTSGSGPVHLSTCCQTPGRHMSSKDGRCYACR